MGLLFWITVLIFARYGFLEEMLIHNLVTKRGHGAVSPRQFVLLRLHCRLLPQLFERKEGRKGGWFFLRNDVKNGLKFAKKSETLRPFSFFVYRFRKLYIEGFGCDRLRFSKNNTKQEGSLPMNPSRCKRRQKFLCGFCTFEYCLFRKYCTMDNLVSICFVYLKGYANTFIDSGVQW